MRKPVKFLLIGAVLLLLIGMLAAVQPARAFEGISSPAVLIQSNSSLLPDVPVLLPQVVDLAVYDALLLEVAA